MLLLRAFYDKFANMKDKQSVKMREAIARCVWKTDELDEPDMERLKIDSENGMWTYLVSVWFLSNRDAEGNLDPLSKRVNLEALGNKALLEKRVNSTRN